MLRSRAGFSFFFLLPLAAPSSSAAEWGGRIYTDQYGYTAASSPGGMEQSSISSWLDYDAHSDSGFGVRAIGQVDGFLKSIENPGHASVRGRIREAYGSFLGQGIEIRLGQQIIPWGKSDGVNPTDYFTAKDYTLLNPDEEVRRIGAPSLNVSYTPKDGASPITVQVVVQATHPETRLLIPDSAVPANLHFSKYGDSPGPFGATGAEAGVKLAWQSATFDASISAFRGYSHFPQYVFNSTTLSVAPIRPLESAVGGDASFTLGNQIIRLETALLMPDNGKSTDPLSGIVEPWHWDSVLGVERPLGDDFRIQLQVLYRWHLNYSTAAATGSPSLDAIRSGISQANQLILNWQHRGNPGATFRAGYQSEHSNFTGDLFLIGWFGSGKDFLFRPQAGWTPATNWKLSLGADFYGGDPSRPLGALSSRSDAFFEAKRMF